MSSKIQYTCIYNLRPRVNGTPMLIMAGTSFDQSVIDDSTFKAMLASGAIKEFEPATDIMDADFVEISEDDTATLEPVADPLEVLKAKALEEFGVELKQRKLATAQAAYDKLVVKAANKPQGIFNLSIEDLADKDLDELDSIHADICADNGFEAPDLFKSVEEAIEKLTSEA